MFMGSGSTGIASVLTGRSFIGIELDDGYFGLAQGRIDAACEQKHDLLEMIENGIS